MNKMQHVLLAACLAAGCVFSAVAGSPIASAPVMQVAGESSRAPAHKSAQTWRASTQAVATARVAYRPLDLSRIVEVQRYNDRRQAKPAQIGIGRRLTREGLGNAQALRWTALPDGGAVARLHVASPDAEGLRVALQVRGLHPQVELRFAGSDDAGQVVAVVRADQAQRLADAAGLYWTPSTDGPAQIIEIYRPAGVPAAMARVAAPEISHLLANSRSDFKIAPKIGESASCNVDAICRVGELGGNYVLAKNAVARMQFIDRDDNGNNASYICTGTLLNDSVAATQVPYFYTAAHCISGQTAASTLNTFWRYERTTCGSGQSGAATQLSGGAAYLYGDTDTDALLLRLNDAAPAGAEFAGWDATAMAPSSAVVAIHHPSGDVKKVSLGTHVPAASDRTHHAVGWTSGTTEGGSSGSGLFTLHYDGYRLRGGLHGGDASCANSGSLGTPGNRDYYSRLDVIFPRIRQWLAPDPIRVNGAQPLVRSAALPVPSTAAAPASAAVATDLPRETVPPSRERIPALPHRVR